MHRTHENQHSYSDEYQTGDKDPQQDVCEDHDGQEGSQQLTINWVITQNWRTLTYQLEPSETTA